jgi:hypothetical protein
MDADDNREPYLGFLRSSYARGYELLVSLCKLICLH